MPIQPSSSCTGRSPSSQDARVLLFAHWEAIQGVRRGVRLPHDMLKDLWTHEGFSVTNERNQFWLKEVKESEATKSLNSSSPPGWAARPSGICVAEETHQLPPPCSGFLSQGSSDCLA